MNGDWESSTTTSGAIGMFFLCVWYAAAAIFLFLLAIVQLIHSILTRQPPHGRHAVGVPVGVSMPTSEPTTEEPNVWRYGY